MSYKEKDILQKSFNEEAINQYSEMILAFSSVNKEPLSIVDLCCGYGGPHSN